MYYGLFFLFSSHLQKAPKNMHFLQNNELGICCFHQFLIHRWVVIIYINNYILYKCIDKLKSNFKYSHLKCYITNIYSQKAV